MTTNHEHLREVAKKATPGPWHWIRSEDDEPWEGGYESSVSLRTVEIFGKNETVPFKDGTRTTSALPKFILDADCIGGDSEADANAEFIATFNPATALALLDELAALRKENERLSSIINTPQADDFPLAVSTEAEHQRQRWGSDHDGGKTPSDWFWLVGYLAGKALHKHADGDIGKAEHHIITTAAACANWHRAMFGGTNMRPGIEAARAAIGDSHE